MFIKPFFYAPMRHLIAVTFFLLAAAWPVAAQPDGLVIEAPIITAWGLNGGRLEGNRDQPAHIKTRELDVKAGVIGVDIIQSPTGGRQATQVRALSQSGHRVQIAVAMTPQGGGQPTQIEATADKATLNPPTRTLILEGNVDGFYQLQQGVRTSLSGEIVNIRYVGKNIEATVQGGAKGVRLVVPPEAIDQPGALGEVIFTAQNASFDENGGVARLTGNARAVSTEGTNKFDIAASEFVLRRAANGTGTIDTLTTVGRTQLKMDLPPEPTTKSTPGVTVGEGDSQNRIGRPTHIEAAADAMTVTRPQNTLVFEGNVQGFYQLSAPIETGTSARYNFSGDRAVVRYAAQPGENVAAGLNVEVTGKPSTIMIPGFNLGF